MAIGKEENRINYPSFTQFITFIKSRNAMRLRNNSCCIIAIAMGRKLGIGEGKSMPQLDFREARLPREFVSRRNVDLSHHLSENRAPIRELTHLERSIDPNRTDRLTLLFAIFTALGGLTCAMYSFNGADPIWRILSSPRESFYGRPAELGTSNPQVGMRQKNFGPRFATSRGGQSNTTSMRRLSSSAVSPISSGASGALSAGQSGAGNSGAASAPSQGSAASGARSTAGGVTSKVATTLRSTNHRTVATARKDVVRTIKNVSKVATKASDTTTNRAAQRSTQNSRSAANPATASMRNIPPRSFSGVGSRPGGGMGGGALGNHR
jgi:hypothetical protein